MKQVISLVCEMNYNPCEINSENMGSGRGNEEWVVVGLVEASQRNGVAKITLLGNKVPILDQQVSPFCGTWLGHNHIF